MQRTGKLPVSSAIAKPQGVRTTWGSRSVFHPSRDQWTAKVPRPTNSMMLDSALNVRVECVESDAVLLGVKDGQEPRSKSHPLRRVEFDLEHRELDSLAPVQAGACDSAKAPAAGRVGGGHVIGDEDEHSLLSAA